MKLKIGTFSLVLILLVQNSISAQNENTINGRWAIKSSVALVQSGQVKLIQPDNVNDSPILKPQLTPSYRIELNYGISKFSEVGFYIGSQVHKSVISTSLNKEYSKMLGVSFNYHLLPLFFKEKSFPLDVYLTANFGGHIFIKNKLSKYYGFNPEYGAGIGLNYFFFKNFGIYADYKLGDYSYWSSSSELEKNLQRNFDQLRAGFVLRF